MNLLFKNPVFNNGRNTTVRRGTKWDNPPVPTEFGFPVIDTANQYDGNGNLKIKGFADNVTFKVKRFCDITPKDICLEHDPICRTLTGLLEVMKNTYDNFDETEIVTLVSFDFMPV